MTDKIYWQDKDKWRKNKFRKSVVRCRNKGESAFGLGQNARLRGEILIDFLLIKHHLNGTCC